MSAPNATTLAILITALILTGCSKSEQSEIKAEKAPNKTSDKDPDNLHQLFVFDSENLSLEEAFNKYRRKKLTGKKWKDNFRAGERAMNKDNYDAAALLLTETVLLKPKHNRAYALRGRCRLYSIKKKDDLAKNDLEKAIKLGNTNPATYIGLATIYDNMERPDRAIEVLSEGIKNTKRKKFDLLIGRASLYTARGDTTKALADYDEVVRRHPKLQQGYFLRGQLHEKIGDYDKAISDYDSAANNNERYLGSTTAVTSLRLKAILLSKEGKHQDAIDSLDDGLKRRPGDDELLQIRGDEYAALGKYQKAIEDFTSAIDGAPKYARLAYKARAKVYKELGKDELAAKDLAKLEELVASPAEKTLFKTK